jgi:hypothetical protein
MPAVPAIGERPTAKMTSAAAAQTRMAATLCGLWSGLVRTKRKVRVVVPCQLARPISGVSSLGFGSVAVRGTGRGRGKGTVGLAGRRDPSKAEKSKAACSSAVSIGLHGAPSIVLSLGMKLCGLRTAGAAATTGGAALAPRAEAMDC